MLLPGGHATGAQEPWRGNRLGADEVVLPGFSALGVDGSAVTLGAGRRYDWRGGLLPGAVTARGRPLTGPMHLVARVGGVDYPVTGTAGILEQRDHHVVLRGLSGAAPGMVIDVRSRVEYDGVTVVDLTITAELPATLERLELRTSLPRSPALRVMAFEPASMFNYRPYLIEPCRASSFRSALGFTYEGASFWLFADDVDPALLGREPTTRLACSGETLELRQPLVASAARITGPVRLRFGFLATPVREQDGAYRADRYSSAGTPDEGNRNLWWIEATAHYALPSLQLPPGATARVPVSDVRAYPGAGRNRAAVAAARRQGVERLPYVSLRSLSFLDPVIGARQAEWRIEPQVMTAAASDGPYRAGEARAILSLRGPGFADYLLWQLAEVADGLDVRGFYFDQAAPAGSANPFHLAQGAGPGSMATDILEMRAFFKRLATLLYQRGRPPLIYAHNSSAPVVPAFTFVTAMVQGEEIIPEIRDLDYLGTLDLDRVRATYAPQASGIPTVWLEELWSGEVASQRPLRYRWAEQAEWLASAPYRQAWRNFMATALLHDIPVWTLAPLAERRRIHDRLRAFDTVHSTFVGYWTLQPGWRDSGILVSAYRSDSRQAALLVVANRGDAEVEVSAAQVAALMAPGELATLTSGGGLAGREGRWRIPARDFIFLALSAA